MELRYAPGTLGRPASEVAAALLTASDAWQADPDSRLFAGALAAGRWLAGLDAERPISGDVVPPTASAAAEETRRAGMIVYGARSARPGIHPEYASGVLMMIEYARGVRDRLPVTVPAQRAA